MASRLEIEDVLSAMELPGTTHGAAYLRILQREYEVLDEAMKMSPRRCRKDLKGDLVYMLGKLDGLRRAIELPRDLCEKRKQAETRT